MREESAGQSRATPAGVLEDKQASEVKSKNALVAALASAHAAFSKLKDMDKEIDNNFQSLAAKADEFIASDQLKYAQSVVKTLEQILAEEELPMKLFEID